jgi:prepilin-type N-terminal cleavage/methylation domain-containing protein
LGNNRGLTLIEVLLSLFIFAVTISVFNGCFSVISRSIITNTIRQEIGTIAKNKMEEIKSGYVYIDNNRYYFLDLGEIINFKEQDYDINISIRPLDNYENIGCVNVVVRSEKGNTDYNLVRYINLHKIRLDGPDHGE